MPAAKYLLAGIALLFGGAGMAATGGDGLTADIDTLSWSKWQGRISIGSMVPRWQASFDANVASGLKVDSLTLLGDYYFARPLLGHGFSGEGIACFNVESEPELELLSEVAKRVGQRATVSIRVNPDVDAKTHHKISTGKAEDKFGISYKRAREVYARAAALPAIDVAGIDMHIGSQITELEPFEKAFRLMAELTQELRQDGHNIRHLDLGGGLGVPYRGTNDVPPHPDEYAEMVKRTLGPLNLTFVLEPGRMIVGNAGVLVSRVIYVKDGAEKHFVIQDAAMNDLIRPTLYDAYHEIVPVAEPSGPETMMADVVGPVCELGDYLAKGRRMPKLSPGDLLATMTAGAYGAVQAGTYNTRPLIAEVLVKDARWALIRPRQSYEELIGLDRLAAWQEKTRA